MPRFFSLRLVLIALCLVPGCGRAKKAAEQERQANEAQARQAAIDAQAKANAPTTAQCGGNAKQSLPATNSAVATPANADSAEDSARQALDEAIATLEAGDLRKFIENFS